jgi:hypothetical protein
MDQQAGGTARSARRRAIDESVTLPLQIRGFGPVRAAAVERARAREAELLEALGEAGGGTAAAKVA